MDHTVTLFYQNVHELNTKSDIFYENVTSSNFNLRAITETWLSSDVKSSEYFSSNFDVYNSNSMGRGRSVALAVKSKFKNTQIPVVFPHPEVNLVAIKIWIHSSHPLNIINLYIPPAHLLIYVNQFTIVEVTVMVLYNDHNFSNVNVMHSFPIS